MKHILAPGLCALALAATLPAAAQAQALIDGSDVEMIRLMLAEHGTASVTTDGVGDPLIEGVIPGDDPDEATDDTKYQVYLFGCNEQTHDNCSEIMFKAAWDTDGAASLDTINTWNADGRYGKAYRDDEGDPVIEYNVNLQGGVSRANLSSTIKLWKSIIGQFEQDVVFK